MADEAAQRRQAILAELERRGVKPPTAKKPKRSLKERRAARNEAKASQGEKVGGVVESVGDGKPTRGRVFLNDVAVPTAKAGAYAIPIGLSETAAMVTGAPASFVAGAADLAGYPGVGESIQGATIEGQRALFGVPQMRAAQAPHLQAAPLPARMGIRGVELAASGIPTTGPLAMLAKNPAAVIKISAAIDAGSGAAGEVVASIAKALGQDADTQEAGRAWTQLATAMGGPALLNFARGSLLGVKDALVPQNPQRLREAVGDQLAGDAADPNALNVARQNAQRFRDEGLDPPPIGSTSGDPTLMAEQQEAIRNLPGAAGKEQARQATTDAGIRGRVEEAKPFGDAQDVSRGLKQSKEARAVAARQRTARLDRELAEAQRGLASNNRAVKDLIEAAGESLEAAVANYVRRAQDYASRAMEVMGPGISARRAGDIFVDELDKARTAFREQANKVYERWLVGTDSFAVDTGAIKAAAETASVPSNPLSAAAETVPTVIKAISEADVATITPRQLQGLRSQLLNDLRLAQGGPNANPKDARRLSEVLDAVDSEFDRIGKELPGWDALNAWYRTGKTALHGGRFKDVGRALTSKGGVEVDPSEVAARFIRSDTATGADEAMEEFNRAFGGQSGLEPQPGLPEGIAPRMPSAVAGKALDEHIVEQVRLAATDPLTGKIDGKALAKWVRTHQTALARRPELAKRLNSVADAQVLVLEETARIETLRKEYESLLKKAASDPADLTLASRVRSRERELNRYISTTTSAEAAWNRAFRLAVEDPQGRLNQIIKKDPAEAGRLFRELEQELAGNPAAQRGLRAGMWESLGTKIFDPETGLAAEGPLTNPKAFAALLRSHGELVTQLFGPERAALLKEMQNLAAMNEAGRLPSPSMGALKSGENLQTLLSHIVSRSWGIARGVVGPGYVITEALARQVFKSKASDINRTEALKLLGQALYDPDVYEDLVKFAKNPRNRLAARRLAARLSYGRQGIGMALDDRPLRTKQDVNAEKERRFGGAPLGTNAAGGIRR